MILGDLSNPLDPSFRAFFDYYSPRFEKIFYISGNHEYYCEGLTFDKAERLIRNVCGEYSNVVCLNNGVFELDPNTVIIGTVLWTRIAGIDFDFKSEDDYMYIYSEPGILATPQFITQLYMESVKWLSQMLDQYKDKTVIVMTHHMPSFELIHKKFRNGFVLERHASHLDYLIMAYDNIEYWLCGHTHVNMNVTIGSCVCLTNPRGYRDENSYDKKATIQIK